MTTVAERYDSHVGREIGVTEVEITPELVRTYSEGLRDPNPWYTDDSPFGGPVAPALILHSAPHRFSGWYLENIYGNLHARQEWALFAPIMVGETVTLRSLITDRYWKRGRDYVVNEVTIARLDGRPLARVATHQSFLPPEQTEGTVVARGAEKAKERRVDADEAQVLETLEPVHKLVDQAMCDAYSGPRRNYHNDLEESRKLGFPEIVVQGTMSTCFISEVMTRHFGAGWWQGGRMNVNFVNVLWANEGVTAHAEVIDRLPEGGRTRHVCRVRVEKDDGTVVTAGTASAVME